MPLKKGQRHSGQFKKGNKSSPGRTPLPADIKEARNLSYDEFCRTVIEVRNSLLKDYTHIETKKNQGYVTTRRVITDEEKIPLGKRAIINAYATLDYKAIKDFEDRLWGKAKETVDFSGVVSLGAKRLVDYMNEEDVDEVASQISKQISGDK